MDAKANIKPLVIKTNLGNSFFDHTDIIRFESDGCNTDIFLSDGRKLQCAVSISVLENELPKNIYFRCHRSHIVNLSYLSNYNGKTSKLTVAEAEVPISESYLPKFMEFFTSGKGTSMSVEKE